MGGTHPRRLLVFVGMETPGDVISIHLDDREAARGAVGKILIGPEFSCRAGQRMDLNLFVPVAGRINIVERAVAVPRPGVDFRI